MALPTSMTIFNRSMINLENEIGILTSYTLHEKVVKELNSNINYYSLEILKQIKNIHLNGLTTTILILKLILTPSK